LPRASLRPWSYLCLPIARITIINCHTEIISWDRKSLFVRVGLKSQTSWFLPPE
jgi:hypothetical protein